MERVVPEIPERDVVLYQPRSVLVLLILPVGVVATTEVPAVVVGQTAVNLGVRPLRVRLNPVHRMVMDDQIDELVSGPNTSRYDAATVRRRHAGTGPGNFKPPQPHMRAREADNVASRTPAVDRRPAIGPDDDRLGRRAGHGNGQAAAVCSAKRYNIAGLRGIDERLEVFLRRQHLHREDKATKAGKRKKCFLQ
jgi:hypothetical protein